MSTTEGSWQAEVHRIIPGLGDGRARIDRQRVRNLVNTYLVRSLDTTALLFAASSLDILIAQADRILVLAGHEAQALDPGEFRKRLDRHLAEVREHLAVKDRRA